MDRRTVLRRTGAVAAAGGTSTIAGCGILGGCGPGETEIGTLAERVENAETSTEAESTATDGSGTEETGTADLPRVKGSIQSFSEEEIIIDDGTGRASLQTLGGFRGQNVGEGDCAYAEGAPMKPEEGTDADVAIFVTAVGLADD